MPLNDRVVVITGAAGALGPAVCREFANAGASLALAGMHLEPLNKLAVSLSLADDRVLTQAANLIDPAEVNTFAQAVRAKFGRADVVLHLVGGYKAGTKVVDLDPADVSAMLDQHLWTTLHMARAFVPGMIEQSWGRVIVISTPLAQAPGAKQAPYAIGKAGQDILMLTLAQELKGTGVTANCIQIRSIETAPPDPVKPRTGSTPAEITAALVWLCGDEAAATNGARIPVFGRA
ncbi:MAG TPA: SDR family oxidoreductase [Anaerolineales bacterium]|nr:SDR family oxidoreductase [Anaerolineales bacterium]